MLILGALAVWLLSDDGAGRLRDDRGAGKAEDPFQFYGDAKNEKPRDVPVRPADVLRDYREWSRYPPDSRPLLRGHTDELRPEVIRSGLQRLVVPDPVTKQPKLSEHYCVLEPETHTALGAEPHNITLRCVKPPSRTPSVVQFVEVRLAKRVQDRLVGLPSPTYGDNGRDGDRTAGDRVYTFQWRPRGVDWGNIELLVRFQIPSEDVNPPREYQLMTSFFSSPHAPARFTGKATEKIVDGSLVISVQLSVTKPGDYEIKGNLFAGDEPIAVSRGRGSLRPGLQTIDLLFFGKIFHDRGKPGPYTLRHLRGIRENLAISPSEIAGKSVEEVNRILEASTRRQAASEPDREVIPFSKEEHRTQSYTLKEFSSAEYESPQKTQRLKMLEEDVRRQE